MSFVFRNYNFYPLEKKKCECSVDALSLKTGKKKPDNVENLILIEGRSKKRVCDRSVDGSALFFDEMAVAVMQHRREQ